MNIDFFQTGGAWASCVDLPSSSDTIDINLLVRRAGGRRKVRQAGSTPVVAVRDNGNLSFNRCKSYLDWTAYRFYRAIMSVQYRTVKYTTAQYSTVQCNSDLIIMLRGGNPTLCLSSVLVLIKETGLPVHLPTFLLLPKQIFLN